MKDKDLLKALLKDGWILTRVHGSHHIVEKNGKIETILIHGNDVPKGMLSAIIKRTGLNSGGIYEAYISSRISYGRRTGVGGVS